MFFRHIQETNGWKKGKKLASDDHKYFLSICKEIHSLALDTISSSIYLHTIVEMCRKEASEPFLASPSQPVL